MAKPFQKGPLCTQSSLQTSLAALGIEPGDTILVHSSLNKLGFVCGGAEAVIQSLLSAIGPSGTLVVPTHTSENSDPKNWEAPPVPPEWWEVIRDNTPAFDPQTSRTRGMGAIPETARTWPGALRSDHPQTSFAAIGSNAEAITRGHALDSMMGEKSPLARLEEVGAKVLLLGVGYDSCTVLHLAEYRVPGTPRRANSFAANVDGKRQWVTVEDVKVESEDFEQLGADYEAQKSVAKGMVGGAECRLIPVREAVAFAQHWMGVHRTKT
ncbi:hypothetical protein K4F52_008569 [Lecanicillium sp. MT-2017a]|nr:hypothetical protein K4F52_008569 [Lecanicillium sp. MT-2017a]